VLNNNIDFILEIFVVLETDQFNYPVSNIEMEISQILAKCILN